MRLRFSALIVSLGLSLSAGMLPVLAQVSDTQVGALVEALRLAAPRTGRSNDGLYSDWQVKPENIPRWSKSCTGKAVTPAQFEADQAMARGILVCVVRDVLRDEYRASGNNETIAVRRVASWWMTGDPTRYNAGDTGTYTQRVLTLYQQRRSTSNPSATNNRPQTQAPPAQNSAQTAQATQAAGVPYDRYMRTGYAATQRKDYPTALLYFKRALDERPEDTYATQAIRNVENYLKKPGQSAAPGSTSSNPTTAAPTSGSPTALNQQQALDLLNRWLQAKSQIFAPPFNQEPVWQLTAGELYDSLVRPDGVLAWLKTNQAYYRYGVQKVDSVERFVSNGDRATIEVKLTEDRTLYANGKIDPKRTDFSAQQVRYSLEWVNGMWKITDYKTVEGSLLERSILNEVSSGRS